MRRRLLLASCAGLAMMAGCAVDEGQRASGDDGRAADDPCGALASAGQRASACDPRLAALAEAAAQGEPGRCRAAIRRFLGDRRPPVVASIYQPGWPDPKVPLSEAERRQLDEMPLPATLEVAPDLAPAPGRPPTAGQLGDRALTPEADGTLVTRGPPGRYDLTLRHAQTSRTHCVHLESCETVRIVAHGAELASHPAVSDGPCELPGT